MPNIYSFAERRDAVVWFLAAAIGFLVAIAAILFRLGIGYIQYIWLGTTSEKVATAATQIPWWLLIAGPTIGGFVVGMILTHVLKKERVETIADVIEAHALHDSYISRKRGFLTALVAMISLGAGASTGREGPVVHMGAAISANLSHMFAISPAARRTLLGAGAAAAVSASFNAPIAGILFAHEVILGHYALGAFVPIVISSVIAATLSRLKFGDFPAFIVPEYQISSFTEIPAFFLLGLTCAIVAILFQIAIVSTDWVARNIKISLWLRPTIGGFIIGSMALIFPEILGVGYETTDQALQPLQLPLLTMLTLIVVKTAATSISLASRFGGGVVAPSLYIGALTGSSFGVIAESFLPELASSNGLYAILGMGAVAASVLGAPISTTLIVFELTGGFAMSIALLLSASIACGLGQLLHPGSFFHWQLGMRGLSIQEGPHVRVICTTRVREFMTRLEDEEERPQIENEEQTTLTPLETLETALRKFRNSGQSTLPVVTEHDPFKCIGEARYVDALNAYNQALIDASVEEHR